MSNLEDFVMVLSDVVREKDCKETIEELERVVFNQVGCEQCTTDCQTMRMGRDDKIPQTELIMNSLWSGIERYVTKHGMSRQFKTWEGFTNIKWNKYTEDKSMDTHIDHNIFEMFDTVMGPNRGIPILSIVGLLNDDFEGGEFQLFEDTTISLKAGDLLIFPSNFLYPHRVLPVTKGTRHSYVSWVY